MNFEVKSVGESPREWSGHGKTFLSYKVDLVADDGILERAVEWNKVADSQAPRQGEHVAGEIEEGKFGPKFKIDYEASKELNQGGSQTRSQPSSEASSGSKGGWQPESERDPERAARILRQHSQEMAIRYVSLIAEKRGDVPQLSEIFQRADDFDQDVIQAGQGSRQGQDASQQVDVASSPPVSPAPDEGSADDQQEREHRLDEALNNAGVVDADERQWLTKAWRELPDKDELSGDERRAICLGSLGMGDLEAVAGALARLRQHAGPMPDSFRTDDIPF